jgi:hypothetical protein
MAKYTISGTVTRTVEVEADTLLEGVKLWQAEAGGSYPDAWEETLEDGDDPNTQVGGVFVGGCEFCDHPISTNEAYDYDGEDGSVAHRDGECPNEQADGHS